MLCKNFICLSQVLSEISTLWLTRRWNEHFRRGKNVIWPNLSQYLFKFPKLLSYLKVEISSFHFLSSIANLLKIWARCAIFKLWLTRLWLTNVFSQLFQIVFKTLQMCLYGPWSCICKISDLRLVQNGCNGQKCKILVTARAYTNGRIKFCNSVWYSNCTFISL